MIKTGKHLVLSLLVMFAVAMLAFAAAPVEPAAASTKVTLSVSGNVTPDYLNKIVNQIAAKYGVNPDDVIIKNAGGTTGNYCPSTPSQAKPAPAPAPNPVDPKPAPAPTPTPTPTPSPGQAGLTADEQEMLDLVNQERTSRGLAALVADPDLVRVARLKAQDMIDNGYFSHTSPTYGSPFDMMKAEGIKYGYAGENLAGASSVESAHQNLMNSSGHRANILNTNFKKVGIGVVNGGPYGKMFVQEFTD